MASTIETYEGDSKTHNVEDGQMKGSEDPTVNEVGGMDLSSYDFTEEESRAVARKFDLRVSKRDWPDEVKLTPRSCRGSSSATCSTRSTETTSPTPCRTAWTVRTLFR